MFDRIRENIEFIRVFPLLLVLVFLWPKEWKNLRVG